MKLIVEDDHRIFYLCCKKDLEQIEVSELNRKPDLQRVLEIIKSQPKNAGLLPSGFIESYKKDNVYYVIDGQHRLLAMKSQPKEPKKALSFVLSVFKNTDDILAEFQRINKNVQVSDLYLSETRPNQQLFESVVDYFQRNFKKFFKTSNCPQQPYTNRDKFLQILFDSETTFNYQEIIQKLSELNLRLKSLKDHPENTGPKITQCRKYDFYLFYAEPFEIKTVLKTQDLINL
jgi:hypothetical protein